MYPSCIYLRAMFSTRHACCLVPVHGTFFFLDVASLRVKGGVPEHRDSGLLPALRPSPSGLPTASRPGMPATAETSPRAGTQGRRVSTSNPACTLKGGCLSIATQGSYRLSGPHPLVMSTASRPGIPATAETSPRARTRGRRVSTSNPACALMVGCLSIATQGSYQLSSPHPLVLSMAS